MESKYEHSTAANEEARNKTQDTNLKSVEKLKEIHNDEL